MRRSYLLALFAAFAFFLAGCDAGGPNDNTPDPSEDTALEAVRAAAVPLSADLSSYNALMELMGDANVVLLGEATHGTEEFYRERERITQRLIQEKGFSAVAIEGDWPDAYRVNRYVRGTSTDASAGAALDSFTDFPRWMWRNTAVVDLVEWLRTHNQSAATDVSFYGLDLYSPYPSMGLVTEYLDAADPNLAGRMRDYYACFTALGESGEAYGQAVTSNGSASCQQEAEAATTAVRAWAEQRAASADPAMREELFNLVQNAQLVEDAEGYYRIAYRSNTGSWNLRDTHMAETVDAILEHLGRTGRPAKVVIWAHNSHVGDARATQQGESGEVTVGQLVRQRGHKAVNIGFTTYTGTVRAASQWGAAPELKQVRPALANSYEGLFHATGVPNFFLPLRGAVADELRHARLERAIGVLYLPETERQSHYFAAELPDQFDAVIHLDETRAVEPLDADQQALTAKLRPTVRGTSGLEVTIRQLR